MDSPLVEKGEIVICSPSTRRIDAANASDLRKQLLACAERGKSRFLINMNLVEFIDSAGLSVIISLHRQVRDKGSVRLCNVRSEVKRVLDMTRLDRLFSCFDSEELALQNF